MHTQCTNNKMEFKPLTGRRVEARFNAGQVTSNAGSLLTGNVQLVNLNILNPRLKNTWL